jgi:hypothetical protein
VIVGPRNLDGSKEIKNRPENRSQTTTSPLVVQNPIDWPVGRENSSVTKHAWSLWFEKGRAGGRARQPARPLAWSRSKHLETTIASGVASYKVIAASLNSSRLLLILFRCLTRDNTNRKSSARMNSHRQKRSVRASRNELTIITSARRRLGLRPARKLLARRM